MPGWYEYSRPDVGLNTAAVIEFVREFRYESTDGLANGFVTRASVVVVVLGWVVVVAVVVVVVPVVVVVVVVVVPVVVVNVVVVVPVDGNVVDVVVVANALIGASKMTTSTAARRTTSRCETLVRLCDTNPPPIGEVATNIDLRGLRIPADIDVGTARLPFASVIVRRRLTS